MKKIMAKLLLVPLLMFPLYGFGYNLNRLQALEIDLFMEEITSSDHNKVTQTANKISASGLGDRRLFDVIEKVLLDYHKKQMSESEDESLVPPMIALIRAMASSGDFRYTPTLQRILDESKSRATRNRSKHVITKISWYSQRNRVMQDMKNHRPERSLQSTRFINLLTHHDLIFRRYAAEEINRLGGADEAVLELMAADLQQGVHEDKGKLHIDVMAWYCRTLGKVAKLEYQDLIDKLIEDKSVHKKVRRHCKKALK
jgi:hypothetical protein